MPLPALPLQTKGSLQPRLFLQCEHSRFPRLSLSVRLLLQAGLLSFPSPKGSCNDPALENIVYYATGEEKKQIKRMLVYHNLFMSAENIQGNLLEEYINNNIQKYGWVWCNGTVLQAIDFCSIDGSVLLQIKNKNNTENSSSSKVRKGTTIEKWYRLGSRKSNGKILPAYKWDILNDIINSHVITDIKPNCKMTEDDYQNFLKQIIKANSDIISEE
mgnify:CR=1 FL=1